MKQVNEVIILEDSDTALTTPATKELFNDAVIAFFSSDDHLTPRRSTTPLRPGGKMTKLIYSARKVTRLKCGELRPDLADQVGDDYILECESYAQGVWRLTKTSLVLNYTEETKTYETRNSFYQVVE